MKDLARRGVQEPAQQFTQQAAPVDNTLSLAIGSATKQFIDYKGRQADEDATATGQKLVDDALERATAPLPPSHDQLIMDAVKGGELPADDAQAVTARLNLEEAALAQGKNNRKLFRLQTQSAKRDLLSRHGSLFKGKMAAEIARLTGVAKADSGLVDMMFEQALDTDFRRLYSKSNATHKSELMKGTISFANKFPESPLSPMILAAVDSGNPDLALQLSTALRKTNRDKADLIEQEEKAKTMKINLEEGNDIDEAKFNDDYAIVMGEAQTSYINTYHSEMAAEQAEHSRVLAPITGDAWIKLNTELNQARDEKQTVRLANLEAYYNRMRLGGGMNTERTKVWADSLASTKAAIEKYDGRRPVNESQFKAKQDSLQRMKAIQGVDLFKLDQFINNAGGAFGHSFINATVAQIFTAHQNNPDIQEFKGDFTDAIIDWNKERKSQNKDNEIPTLYATEDAINRQVEAIRSGKPNETSVKNSYGVINKARDLTPQQMEDMSPDEEQNYAYSVASIAQGLKVGNNEQIESFLPVINSEKTWEILEKIDSPMAREAAYDSLNRTTFQYLGGDDADKNSLVDRAKDINLAGRLIINDDGTISLDAFKLTEGGESFQHVVDSNGVKVAPWGSDDPDSKRVQHKFEFGKNVEASQKYVTKLNSMVKALKRSAHTDARYKDLNMQQLAQLALYGQDGIGGAANTAGMMVKANNPILKVNDERVKKTEGEVFANLDEAAQGSAKDMIERLQKEVADLQGGQIADHLAKVTKEKEELQLKLDSQAEGIVLTKEEKELALSEKWGIDEILRARGQSGQPRVTTSE